MSSEITLLMVTAASIGFIHTLLGPDHYLPFIVMAQANNWSRAKTTWITILCGIGHVGSSVLLGLLGITLGIAVSKLEGFELLRGNLAAWFLISFGLVYFTWGMRKAIRNKPHEHRHSHANGTSHTHSHVHIKNHAHIHTKEGKANLTPWVLFTIFVLGPCEPLIPIVMYPASKNSMLGVVLVSSVFAVVTIGTMTGLVLISLMGVRVLPMKHLERYIHAMAGATIFLCGVSIQFLGL